MKDPVAAQQALQQIASSMLRVAPGSFRAFRASFRAAGPMGTYDFWVTDESSREQRWETSPDGDFHFGFEDLREATYTDGQGAWYTANVTVTPDGEFTAEYDYDTEPNFPRELVPATWVEDLEAFPRDEEHRPQWLKDKIAAAQK